MNINEILNGITEYFNTNETKDVNFRLEQLRLLKKAIKFFEPEIVQALRDDLRKPDFEIYTSEIGVVLQEIDFAVKHLKKWARPEKASVPIYLKPAMGKIIKEPYGTVLIIGPYNYPFQLIMAPLIGAIAAGNCAVLKSSKNTPSVAKVIYKIIEEYFNDNYIKCIMPTEISTEELVSAKFDYIFFTGSTPTGKLVAEAAARNLTPYTLELGGKTPVIVDKTANLEFAAKKITWGKFLNMGQTCVAPDFVLVHSEIKEKLTREIIKSIKYFYGIIPQESKDLGRIINESEFLRLKELIAQEAENIIYGGQSDECGLYIEPTILDIKTMDSAVMQDEIFGPILPIISYNNIDDVISVLRKRPKPLALYVFTKDKGIEQKVLRSISFGGGAVNDTINHIISPSMPFGGIGSSGTGQYHGKYSFDTFTHLKSILVRNSDFEIDIMYPPYNFETTKKVRKFFG